MNKQELQSILKDLAEQKAPARETDLWPAIQSRLTMSQPRSSKGTIMNTHSNLRPSQRPLKPALILLAVLLVGALFVHLPQGRALAQQMLHFFNRGESNLMAGVTVTPVKWVEQTPGVPAATMTPLPPQPTPDGPAFEADCGSYQTAHCSVDAIRERVTFPVFALAELPGGMIFSGATGGPEQVHLFYTMPNQTGNLLIWQEPFTGAESQTAWEVGADAEIQPVPVGAVTGEYVKGSYDGSSNPPVWNANLDNQMLRWVNQGVLFNLYMLGTEPRLSRDELAALAATLTDGPVGESGQPVALTPPPDSATEEPYDPRAAYPLTLAEAEEKAGFEILAPARLPERLSFIGAKYDEETKVVELFYHYDHPTHPEATDALIVSEQLAPEGSDCDLCGFVQGNGKQVDQYPLGKLVSEDATIETVPVGEYTGQYLEGIGWTSKTACCGWQWDPTPYIKRLRFRVDERAIAVNFYGFELTRADVIAIAEQMK